MEILKLKKKCICLGVTNTCKIENGGCSHNCMFDRSSLQITCKCDDPFVLSSDGKTCVNPGKLKLKI